MGDIYKLKVNINGVDYTRDGIKEALKDASGAIQKDSNGNDRYATKNKIEFRKTGGGIEFDFFYSQLLDGENVLYIKNDNTNRESNKVSFFKNSNKAVNYNYLTGTIADTSKKETISFKHGQNIDKKINPTNMKDTDRNISLGNIEFANLKSNEYYILSFRVDTDLKFNPFSSLSLDTLGLETVKNGNTLSFVFQKQGF